ncbi:MAG: histidine kinase N-terminal 7TM domain-containing protein [Clostridiaceae bacterium]
MTAIIIYFIIICISILSLTYIEIYIINLKNKKQVHIFFFYAIFFLIIYNIGMAILISSQIFFNYKNIFIEYIIFFGITNCSVFFLLFSLVYVKQKLNLNKYLILFIIPGFTNIILWTNSYHKFFYKEYGLNTKYSFGPYFYIHICVTWIYILAAIGYLLYFSSKNSGFFVKQTKLIILGSIIPLPFNISWIIGNMLDIDYLKFYSPYDISPITLTITIIFFALAIFKFDFLNIVPIALQRIVDIISDGFLVVDEEYSIIDYNKTFLNTFSNLFSFKRKDNVISILKDDKIIDSTLFLNYVNKAVNTRESVLLEKHIKKDNFDKCFTVEITPIFSEDKKKFRFHIHKFVSHNVKSSLIGIIILFKDITDHKKHIEAIKEQQAILLEQERLASLGQLIGGIAHNLKTPIMSIAGGIEALRDLAFEYRDSIGDMSVTDQDHKEIAKEMMSWLDRIKPYCSYMSDVISAVKGQAVQMNASITSKFTVDELIKRVELLMKHELKKFHCVLDIVSQIDMTTEIKGEVNNLVQVFDNIIINAMQSYEGQNGSIELKIVRSGDNVEFSFKDYGKGIPKEVTDKLFREMVTTKGKNGTGLGLYMSYSTIKGRFGGNMSFTSKEGCGTTIFISIPCIVYSSREAE